MVPMNILQLRTAGSTFMQMIPSCMQAMLLQINPFSGHCVLLTCFRSLLFREKRVQTNHIPTPIRDLIGIRYWEFRYPLVRLTKRWSALKNRKNTQSTLLSGLDYGDILCAPAADTPKPKRMPFDL